MDFKKKIKAAGKFAKENKLLMLQLGMMGAVLITNEVSLASSADETFAVVTNPLEKLQKTITIAAAPARAPFMRFAAATRITIAPPSPIKPFTI